MLVGATETEETKRETTNERGCHIDDDELDLPELNARISASEFLRPVLAEWIQDESETSFDCVMLCNLVVEIMRDTPESRSELVRAVKAIRYGNGKAGE